MGPASNSTPKLDGWRMPGEFEVLHERVFMKWPVRADTWRQKAKPAQKAFTEVAKAILQFEDVTMLVDPPLVEEVRALLPEAMEVHAVESDDCWMRDIGPTFLIPCEINEHNQEELRGVDWDFNAWGGKEDGLYYPYEKDVAVAGQVLEIAKVRPEGRYKSDMVLEPGSIHVDGEGTLLTTEECLLNPNRNPHLSREEIEERLKSMCNVDKIIWLGKGVYNDETDGHIDNLACFIRPGVVALTWTDDTEDPQYRISLAAFERLSEATDAKGRKLEIHKLHQPRPLYLTEEEAKELEEFDAKEGEGESSVTLHTRAVPGSRLAASYVNFYICQGVRGKGIVVPTFGDEEYDAAAVEKLQSLFPERTIVAVPYGREILLGGGNIHCITQQQPLVLKK